MEQKAYYSDVDKSKKPDKQKEEEYQRRLKQLKQKYGED